MKKLISLLMTCLLGVSLSGGASRADVIDGKFGKAQVFDVSRSPVLPLGNQPITLSNFQNPMELPNYTPYTIACGQYIQFFYAGGGLVTPMSIISVSIYVMPMVRL